jgi:hypothetical protein
MKIPLRLLCLILLFAAVAFPLRAAPDTRVYELRIYTAAPGKLDAVLARFRDHTCKLFEKHGIVNIGYWVPLDMNGGDSAKLYYVIAHQSREAAKASWAAFNADPEWQAVKTASEANGKIVAKTDSTFLTAADFSPAFAPQKSAAPRVFSLHTYTAAEGKLPALEARYRDHTRALYAQHDITDLAYWHPLDADKGAGRELIFLLAYPSRDEANKSGESFRTDPAWIKVKADSEKDGKLTTSTLAVFLQPTDFSPLQ